MKYKVVEGKYRYDVVTVEKGYIQTSFWKKKLNGLKDAKTWADWVCKQLNGDVKV